jgi:putative hemolysin
MKLLIVVFVMMLLVTGCSSAPATLPPLAMPNPASANCAKKGGDLEIRTEPNGEAGYCRFPDGSECEEWAFFRNECRPRTPIVLPTIAAGLPNPASANCVKQGGELVIRTDASGDVG